MHKDICFIKNSLSIRILPMYYSCINRFNYGLYWNIIYVKNINLPAYGIIHSNTHPCRTIIEQCLNIHSNTPPCRTIIEQCLNIHINTPPCRTIIEQCLTIHINTPPCRTIIEQGLNIYSNILPCRTIIEQCLISPVSIHKLRSSQG